MNVLAAVLLALARQDSLAVTGGDVHTISRGVLKGATVWVKDGKIHRIGQNLDLPAGLPKVDAKGRPVLPGFVAAYARGIGLSGANGKIADSWDPYAESVKLALAGGVTSFFLEAGPQGGIFGPGAPPPSATGFLKTTYGSLAGTMVAEPASAALNSWIGGTVAERHEVREQFLKAREHLEKERDFERRRAENRLKPNESPVKAGGTLETFVKLLKGEMIARARAASADEILRAADLAEEFRFRLVLTGATEAWTVAERLGRAGVEVVFSVRVKEHARPGATRPEGSSLEQAAILKRAGVRFAIVPPTPSVGTGGIAGKDLLTMPIEAAFAVRGGLDEASALRAITLDAARVCGQDARVGSIDEGKDGDLLILSGDPLDYRTWVDATIVGGRLLYDRSKDPWFSHFQGAAR